MTTEHELSRRLAVTAEAISGRPDLDAVIERSLHKRARSRRVVALSAVAVAMTGVGALVLVANRDPSAASDSPTSVEFTTPTSGTASANGTNVSDPTTADQVPATTPMQPSTLDSLTPPDLADPYLDRTTVVFDQVMDDDLRFVIRISDVSYGELFGIDWTAPTGSTDECLSGPALIGGDPDGLRANVTEASSWYAFALPPLSGSRPTNVAESPTLFGLSTDSVTSVFVVRTQLPVEEVVVQGDGITSARTEFVDGVAAIEVTSALVPVEPGSATRTVLFDQATLTMQPQQGSEVDPALLTLPLVGDDGLDALPPGCLPPDVSHAELPVPGKQPDDPDSAAAVIRERFALAVDPSIPFDDKPDDLFDSAVGLEQAISEALAGPNSEYVKAARYEIIDIVFTSPNDAWFRYDLNAQGVLFQAVGRANLDGASWQISRNTLCQELARTGAICDPLPSIDTIAPPSNGTAAPTTTLNEQQQAAYGESLRCNPIIPCQER